MSAVISRIIVLVAVSAIAAGAVVLATPQLWQSTARLEAAVEVFDPVHTASVVASGAVLSELATDPEILDSFGLTGDPTAAAELSRRLSRQLVVIPDEQELFVGVRDRDGERACRLVEAVVRAAREAETETLARRFQARAEELEAEVGHRRARIEELSAEPTDADPVAGAVRRARIEEAARRLASAEEDLAELRNRPVRIPWLVADAPVPNQHLLTRRLGPAAAAAVAAPLLLVALALLLADRPIGS